MNSGSAGFRMVKTQEVSEEVQKDIFHTECVHHKTVKKVRSKTKLGCFCHFGESFPSFRYTLMGADLVMTNPTLWAPAGVVHVLWYVSLAPLSLDIGLDLT